MKKLGNNITHIIHWQCSIKSHSISFCVCNTYFEKIVKIKFHGFCSVIKKLNVRWKKIPSFQLVIFNRFGLTLRFLVTILGYFSAIQGGNKRQFERLNLSKIFEKVSFSVKVMDNYACRLWQAKNLLSQHFGQTKQKCGWTSAKKTTTKNKKKPILKKIQTNKFGLKNVQTLCPTTVRLLSDMSKFWSLSVQWATVICSPVSVTFLFCYAVTDMSGFVSGKMWNSTLMWVVKLDRYYAINFILNY